MSGSSDRGLARRTGPRVGGKKNARRDHGRGPPRRPAMGEISAAAAPQAGHGPKELHFEKGGEQRGCSQRLEVPERAMWVRGCARVWRARWPGSGVHEESEPRIDAASPRDMARAQPHRAFGVGRVAGGSRVAGRGGLRAAGGSSVERVGTRSAERRATQPNVAEGQGRCPRPARATGECRARRVGRLSGAGGEPRGRGAGGGRVDARPGLRARTA